MNIKKSYVYKSIRRAAAQSLLSLDMLQFCVCAGFFVLLTPELPDAFASNEYLIMAILMLLFDLGLIIFIVFAIIRLIQTVVTLIFPEKGIAAKRYADIVSFEEICELVESQRLQPLAHLEYWGVSTLKDLIIYECYGKFFMIPYSAIQKIYVWWPTHNEDNRQKCAVAIQDTSSHRYVIICADRDERNEVIQTLYDVLQLLHVEVDYS